MVKLGILDYGQRDEGESPETALAHSVELAQLCDQLGYQRFWVAEHHDVPAFSSSSPEVFMTQLLNQTQNIRIGSGGVMLPHYAPMKVAENFKMMLAFHPDRIDLGLGNTAGTLAVRKAMETKGKADFDYEESIQTLQAYLLDQAVGSIEQPQAKANPASKSLPLMWALSSSVRSARMAARLGMAYTFGLFPYASANKRQVAKEACRVYREEFQASAFLDKPYVSVAPFVAVADDEELAQAYGQVLDLWLLGKDNFAEFSAFPSLETAQTYDYSDQDREQIAKNRSRMLVGGAKSVANEMYAIADETQADELLLIPLMPGIDARKEAVSLLAQVF
ncbi:LLM class flavin-dependent oxidoreductase [Aerococcus kribbianus]|uniref:LLM class flavin-dependent oxidoreductase n=1 Tax=Aerococcus kribbianus TaxID=2999064 RepID=A0A9X3JEG6_9LACT|nr:MULTISPECIES: LLM class flavin-dependent oxidoreductase [unclassified Aerococcus]MCZ0717109.1 LLM class flavin-dependent oxidoreductase [Aerococcus sp. YH-aer221]MCZ0725397.1 LLM class flavin-dependent oxidoreductase [Aerococcus sp. YH-aer222]